MPSYGEAIKGDSIARKMEEEFRRSRAQADKLAANEGEAKQPHMTLMGWADNEIECLLIEEERRNPDAHLGAEEKPYVPLVQFQHHGQNVHSHGKYKA